jgi:hypothetical protein
MGGRSVGLPFHEEKLRVAVLRTVEELIAPGMAPEGPRGVAVLAQLDEEELNDARLRVRRMMAGSEDRRSEGGELRPAK